MHGENLKSNAGISLTSRKPANLPRSTVL